MEAKEVRIGNLVLFKGKSETVYQVRDSGCDFLIGKSKTKTLTQSFVWSAIEGIPLSEEWLLKFGFEERWHGHSDNTYYRRHEFSNWAHSITFSKTGIVMKHGFMNQWSELKSLKYVHELQNLYFALTGDELTAPK